jgi:hypothetical protein
VQIASGFQIEIHEATMRRRNEWERRQSGAASAVLWGAAHALDLGGVLHDEQDWRGFAADAEAIRGYWEFATEAAFDHVAKAREKRPAPGSAGERSRRSRAW